jgi:hypothetical protein
MLLARHKQIVTIGELKATAMGPLANYACSCGEKIEACPFWHELGGVLTEKNVDFSLDNFGTHFRSPHPLVDAVLRVQPTNDFVYSLQRILIKSFPPARKTWNNTIIQNKNLIGACMQLQQGQLFLDGSKDANRLLYFLDSDLWDLKVIRMHRDGRAQVRSRRRKGFHTGKFSECVQEWRHTISEMDFACRKFKPEQVFTLTYESLCSMTDVVMDELWRFLELEGPDLVNESEEIASKEMHILGNSAARTKGKVRISLDEKWRDEISNDELTVFDQVAGETNRRLGYEP